MDEPEREGSTHIPHVIWELGLLGLDLDLYFYLKSVAGEDGTCTQDVRTIQKKTSLPSGAITGSMRVLEATGLVTVDRSGVRLTTSDSAGNAVGHVRIVDIWDLNDAYCEGDPSALATIRKLRSLAQRARTKET
jgi:hypothetical protein